MHPHKVKVGQCIITEKKNIGLVLQITNCDFKLTCEDPKTYWGLMFHVLIDQSILRMLYDEFDLRLIECL